jgi:hypothetical protein
MSTTFQVIALSSFDPTGADTHDEPKLVFPDALKAAQELKAQGKVFRVVAEPLNSARLFTISARISTRTTRVDLSRCRT